MNFKQSKKMSLVSNIINVTTPKYNKFPKTAQSLLREKFLATLDSTFPLKLMIFGSNPTHNQSLMSNKVCGARFPPKFLKNKG